MDWADLPAAVSRPANTAPSSFQTTRANHDKYLSSESRRAEEVRGRYDIAMIAQKGRPELAFPVGRRHAKEIAKNGRFGNLKSKLKNFVVNSRSAPGRILFDHLANDSSNLGIDFRPAKALWT